MTTSAYQETKSLGFKGVLKWYFSPYLSTLITAPMFFILSSAILFYVGKTILQFIIMALHTPTILVISVLFLPVVLSLLSLSATITYITLVGLPKIWQKRGWPLLLRIFLILVIFIGGPTVG